MKPINPKRKKFCRLVAEGETGTGAYRKAYKNKNSTTCKTNAHRLMQQPNVLVYLSIIQGAHAQAQPQATENTPAPKQPTAKKPVAKAVIVSHKNVNPNYRVYDKIEVAERQTILTEIARGQSYIFKYRVTNGQLIEIPIKPNFRQRLSSIKELNKMDGAYA